MGIDSINISTDAPLIIPLSAADTVIFRLDTTIMSDAVYFQPDTITLTSTLVEVHDNWHSGLEGSARQGSLTGNSGILTIIVVLFVIMSLNFKECRKLFSRFTEELRSDKKRENAFSEHTNHETRLTIFTVIQFIIYSGILLCAATITIKDLPDSYMDDFDHLLSTISIMAFYYIFQICVYSITGYTFADTEGSRRWLRSLNATQSMAGVALMIPALLALFYPGTIATMCIVAGTVYLIARVVFIIKWFSIFYRNIFSSVYFILYLCALEIIPLIYVFRLALLID